MTFNPMQEADQRRDELFRSLPSVNDILLAPEIQKLVGTHGHERVVDAVREGLGRIRADIANCEVSCQRLEREIGSLADRVSELLRRGPD